MKQICVFFGHREIPENIRPLLLEQVRRAAEEHGITEFWNGGYGGFDHLAADVVYELKKTYPHITHRRVYAYPPQSSLAGPRFDGAFCPDCLDLVEDRARIPRRNIWMAEQADLIIAYVCHAESTIHEPLDHALKLGKPMVNLGSYQPVIRTFWWEEK